MAQKAANKVIGALIDRVREHHDEAGLVIKSAETFAKHGKADRALKTLMDFEGPTRDALDLFKTALTVKRELLKPDD